MTGPRPGDYFVETGQGWVAEGIRLFTRSPVNHAGLVVGTGTRAQTLEAHPGGASYRHLRPGLTVIHPPLTTLMRAQTPAVAARLVGRGYSIPGCAALGLLQFGIRLPAWTRGKLGDPLDQFCSQQVDYAEMLLGFHIFDDGRDPGDVTPGDLLVVAIRSNWPITYL